MNIDAVDLQLWTESARLLSSTLFGEPDNSIVVDKNEAAQPIGHRTSKARNIPVIMR